MSIDELIKKLRWFVSEAVCGISDSCIPGFISGAFYGWGDARVLVGKWLNDLVVSSLPKEAVCFFRDGNKWCCVFGDFINLQESIAGFGDTFEEALENLRYQCVWGETVKWQRSGLHETGME